MGPPFLVRREGRAMLRTGEGAPKGRENRQGATYAGRSACSAAHVAGRWNRRGGTHGRLRASAPPWQGADGRQTPALLGNAREWGWKRMGKDRPAFAKHLAVATRPQTADVGIREVRPPRRPCAPLAALGSAVPDRRRPPGSVRLGPALLRTGRAGHGAGDCRLEPGRGHPGNRVGGTYAHRRLGAVPGRRPLPPERDGAGSAESGPSEKGRFRKVRAAAGAAALSHLYHAATRSRFSSSTAIHDMRNETSLVSTLSPV